MTFSANPGELLANIGKLSVKFFEKSRAFSFLSTDADISGRPVCIACSGGSDSVFLTLVFCAFFGKNERLAKGASILHLNHNLRGEESICDAKFVEQLAKYLGLNFMLGTLGQHGEKPSEGELRAMRYGFFSRQMRELGSNILLLGQQKNDAAETLIMRLTRASGLDGLLAPREIRRFADGTVRLRPLLTIKKDEIEDILRQCGVTWRVDSSNLSCDYFRNVVRNVVIRELQRAVPQYDVVSNIAVSRQELSEADDAIEDMANATIAVNGSSETLDTRIFCDKPVALVRRVLYNWLLSKGIGVKKSEFERLLRALIWRENIKINAVRGNGLALFQGTLAVFQKSSGVKKLETEFCFENLECGLLVFPNGRTLSSEVLRPEDCAVFSMEDLRKRAYVSWDGSTPVNVRSFDPDLQYVRFGHSSPKRLCKILGCAVENYRNHPIVFLGDQPCWIPGLAVSNLFKIKEDTSHALLLTYS
jgi:tRNA(Ile)-lysidine synthase